MVMFYTVNKSSSINCVFNYQYFSESVNYINKLIAIYFDSELYAIFKYFPIASKTVATDQKGKFKLISREQADNANAKHEKKNRTLKKQYANHNIG